MPDSRSLFTPWHEDAINLASSVVMTNPDTAYPIGNAVNEDPEDTAKASGTTTTVTVTLPSSMLVQAAFVGNTNATSMAIQNNSGSFNQAIAVPPRTVDGKQVNGFVSWAGTSDTIFKFVLSKTGAAVLEFGRLCLLLALREMVFVARDQGTFGLMRPGTIDNVTRYGSRTRASSPVLQRYVSGVVRRYADLDTHLILDGHVNGLNRGFFFVPDDQVNAAWYAQLGAVEAQWSRYAPAGMAYRIRVEEKAQGAPPDYA